MNELMYNFKKYKLRGWAHGHFDNDGPTMSTNDGHTQVDFKRGIEGPFACLIRHKKIWRNFDVKESHKPHFEACESTYGYASLEPLHAHKKTATDSFSRTEWQNQYELKFLKPTDP